VQAKNCKTTQLTQPQLLLLLLLLLTEVWLVWKLAKSHQELVLSCPHCHHLLLSAAAMQTELHPSLLPNFHL